MRQVFLYMRFAQECRVMAANETDETRKAELLELSENYEKLAANREAFLKNNEEKKDCPEG